MALNARQRRFVAEYLVDLNATQAAIRAGYSKRTAKQQGSRLLTNADVQAAVATGTEAKAKRADLTAAYVIESIREVAERCMQRRVVMAFDRADKAYAQAVDEETGEGLWQFDSSGANKALELLGKHLKLFTDKVEHAGADGAPLSITFAQARRSEPT